MKYLILFFLLNLTLCIIGNSQVNWSMHYEQISQFDEFFQQDVFLTYGPEPTQKTWNQLHPHTRMMAKRHMRTFHGARIHSPNDISGVVQTTGRAIGKVFIYVTTSAVAAIVVGTLINQPARHF